MKELEKMQEAVKGRESLVQELEGQKKTLEEEIELDVAALEPVMAKAVEAIRQLKDGLGSKSYNVTCPDLQLLVFSEKKNQ